MKGAARGRAAAAAELPQLVVSRSPEDQRLAAAHAALSEELALALLERRDLDAGALEAVAHNRAVAASRKVRAAVVRHPRAPRHVSIPLARQLYTFELMNIALAPTLAADLKKVCEEIIVARLESVTTGERLTLARRGSAGLAAALLLDPEERVIRAALESPRMTEGAIVRAIGMEAAPVTFVHAVVAHPQWSVRQDVRYALLRSPHTPLAFVLRCADAMAPRQLQELLDYSKLAANVKDYLRKKLQAGKRGLKPGF